MDKKHFKRLLESVREMKNIEQSKIKPARITKIDPVSIKACREKLKLSQSDFAFMIGVSVSTLRNWEQGVRAPEGPAIALLRVTQKNPQAVYEALHA